MFNSPRSKPYATVALLLACFAISCGATTNQAPMSDMGGQSPADLGPAVDLAPRAWQCTALTSQQIQNQTCAPSTDADRCKRCMNSRCCQTESTCNSCADCGVGIKECLRNCDSYISNLTYYKCSESCFALYPDGGRATAPHFACADIACTADCSSGSDPCQQCLITSCKAPYIACHSDPECYSLLLCTLACIGSGDTCLSQCSLKHLAGRKLFDELYQICMSTQCPVVC